MTSGHQGQGPQAAATSPLVTPRQTSPTDYTHIGTQICEHRDVLQNFFLQKLKTICYAMLYADVTHMKTLA